MYYYIYGEPVYRTTITESTDEDGEISYISTVTESTGKILVTEEQMLSYFYSGTDVYVNDGTSTEDTLVTQDFIDSLGTLITTEEEELVGSNGDISSQTVTTYAISRATNPVVYSMEYTSVDVTISSVSGNSTFITTLTPRLTNYDLVGVSGWSVAGVSTLLPFRLYVKEGTLYIGLRNIAGSVVTNKVLTVYLTWRLDRTDFVNLEESTEEEVIG